MHNKEPFLGLFLMQRYLKSIFYYSYYIPFSLHRNHMGCENSQLLQNLPNDRETIEKTAMLFDKICNVPQEDQENSQKIEVALKSDGDRTIRNQKENIPNYSQEMNEQTSIHQQAATRIKGYNSNGTREGCGLSKFAVPRNKQLPDLNRRRQLGNSQQNIQVEENQALFGELKEGDKIEDLMAAIVVDNAVYTQKRGFYENQQRQCISQEINSEELGENRSFSVIAQLQQQPQESQTQKLREQIEEKVQSCEVQCLPSSLLPNIDPTTNNACIQVHHQQGCNSVSSKHSISSTKSFEPLIIVLTEKGETFNQES